MTGIQQNQFCERAYVAMVFNDQNVRHSPPRVERWVMLATWQR
jgi:hypothetical protein